MSGSLLSKLMLIGGSVGTVTAVTVTHGFNDISVPLLGVPITAITMAGAGAAFAFAWTQAESTRAKMFGVWCASTFVGAACVSVLPHLFHEDWPKELQPPLALLFGMLAPWAVPAARAALPALFTGLANTIVRTASAKADAVGKAYIPGKKTDEGAD